MSQVAAVQTEIPRELAGSIRDNAAYARGFAVGLRVIVEEAYQTDVHREDILLSLERQIRTIIDHTTAAVQETDMLLDRLDS